jgi:hypothetical protein
MKDVHGLLVALKIVQICCENGHQGEPTHKFLLVEKLCMGCERR